jgi:predicted phosphodiesterase
MSHGSPWSNDYYIYPDCDQEIIEKCDSKVHDFVLIGHSHYSFAVKSTNSILINPGSVGQSRQAGGKASWSIINTKNSCFQMFSTEYNIENLLREVEEKDPEIIYLAKVLKRK